MKYYTKDKKEVSVEKWVWAIVYSDDTELHQFQDGEFHHFGDIDFDRVKLFSMYKFNSDLSDKGNYFYIPVNDDIQIFHFYRNIRPAGESSFKKVYVFGYKFKGSNDYDEEGNVKKQHAVYHFILPNNHLITSPVDNIDLTKFGV